MEFIDTHTHFYLEHFDSDREEVMNDCLQSGVRKMFLPNIDSHSLKSMLEICKQYPSHCYPMLGLHPSDVKENYQEELDTILQQFDKHTFIAIGEVGMDLYWDRTFIREQENVLRQQIDFALRIDLPLVIHSRKSFAEILAIFNEYSNHSLKGVFHCFSGDINQAKKVIKKGFYLGIGGTITYKNSGIQHVVKEIPLKHLLLETDSPFLPPVPYRGKRNQSSYLSIIANHIAEIKGVTIEEVAATTTENAKLIFNI